MFGPVVISSPGDFPLTYKKGFKIKTGHRNLVALSAVRVDADKSMRSLDPNEERKCLFDDETKLLKFHKRYSQANCFLECSLSNAQDQTRIVNNDNKSCTPWYFPMNGGKDSVICDPWEALTISQSMQNILLGETCKKCLPGRAILKAFLGLNFRTRNTNFTIPYQNLLLLQTKYQKHKCL